MILCVGPRSFPWRAISNIVRGSIVHKSVSVILLFMLACVYSKVGAADGQPAPAPVQVALWPGTPPDSQPAPGPQTDSGNIVRPTLTVYPPQRESTGIAIVVFPGGGFEGLAIKGE